MIFVLTDTISIFGFILVIYFKRNFYEKLRSNLVETTHLTHIFATKYLYSHFRRCLDLIGKYFISNDTHWFTFLRITGLSSHYNELLYVRKSGSTLNTSNRTRVALIKMMPTPYHKIQLEPA